MLNKFFDVIVGFILNRQLEKEMDMRQRLFKGKAGQIPSKLFDKFINVMMATRYSYFMKLHKSMLYGHSVEMPSNIFDWKALERASGYLRLYMDECCNEFQENYDGHFPTEDFKDWFREAHQVHIERPARETTKKSVSEALLADDLPRV